MAKNLTKITLLAFLLVSLAFSNNITQISINQVEQFYISHGKQYYGAVVKEIQDGVDLIVQLNDLAIKGDSSLRVFLGRSDIPAASDKSYCSTQQIRNPFCVIKSDKIIELQNILVEISCSSPCKHSLHLIYKKRLTFSLEESQQGSMLIFKKDEMREVQVSFPITLNKDQKVLVSSQFNNYYEFSYSEQSEFGMFANLGEEFPTNNNKAQFQTISLNQYTIGILLEATEIGSHTALSVMIKGPENAIIMFTAELYETERHLYSPNQEINGVLKANEQMYFTFDFNDLLIQERNQIINESKKDSPLFVVDFLFNLVPFSGNSDLYAHYGETRPISLDEFDWKSKQTSKEDTILVSQEELNKKGFSQNRKIYLAVDAKDITTFSLQLDIYTKDSLVQLKFGQPITGYLSQDGIKHYQFQVQGNKEREIQITLISLQGNSDLFVKKTESTSIQSISIDEIGDYYYKDISTPFLGVSSHESGVDIIKFQFDPKKCMQLYHSEQVDDPKSEFTLCHYHIAVIGKITQTNYKFIIHYQKGKEKSNKYTLKTSSNQPESITSIMEGDELYLTLGLLEKQYFVYKPLKQDTSIEKISFQLQISNGYSTISVDRNLTKLNQYKAEKNTESGSARIQEYTQKEFKGESLTSFEYFIMVEAFERSYCSLFVEITRKGQRYVNYVEIPRDTHKTLIIKQKSENYFQFHSQESGVTIVAKSFFPIKMYIGNQKLVPPSEQNHLQSTDEKSSTLPFIKIINCNFEEDEQKQDQLFYGTIVNQGYVDISVEVQVQTNFQSIYSNQIIEEFFFEGVIQTFYWIVNKFEKQQEAFIFIFSDQLVSNIEFTVNIKVNDVNNIQEYQIKEVERGLTYYKVQLGPAIYKQYCPFLFNEEFSSNVCFVYILARSKIDQKLLISVDIPSEPKRLVSYGSMISQLPLKDEVKEYIYIIEEAKEIILNVQSYNYPVIVLGKIHQFEDYLKNKKSMFATSPSNKKLAFSSNIETNHHIRISLNTLRNKTCEINCVLAISVILPPPEQQQDKDNVKGGILKLSVNGDHMQQLSEGETIKGEVGENNFVYYKISVYLQDKFSQILTVSLTPLNEGNPDLYLNKDDQKLPTLKEYDLASANYAGDFIQVDNKTFKKEKQGVSGSYIIGVFCPTQCQYSISYSTGNHKIQQLQENQIQSASLHKGNTSYFVFHNINKKFFTVAANLSQGSFDHMYIFLKEISEDFKEIQNLESDLIDINNADESSKYSHQQQILRYENSNCKSCVYLIGVKAQTRISFSIQIMLDEIGQTHIQSNIPQMFYLQKEKEKNLILSIKDDFSLFITSFSGSCIEVIVNPPQQNKLITGNVATKICNQQENSALRPYSTSQVQVVDLQKFMTQNDLSSSIVIKLLSPFQDDTVIVQAVTESQTRLITSSIPIQIEVSITNPVVQLLYYSSYEELQSVQVHISPLEGEESLLSQLKVKMEIVGNQKQAYQETLIDSQDILAKSFLTNMNQQYKLIIKYKGILKFKFTILLKELNNSNIHILDGAVLDVLPDNETSSYIVHTQPNHQLLIQNFACQDYSKVFVYKNQKDMLLQSNNQEKLDKKMSSNHEVEVYQVEKNNKGQIYLQKRVKFGHQDVSKSIMTATDFAENEPIIYDYVQIGERGILSYEIDETHLNIQFYDLECIVPNCEKVRGLDIVEFEYQLHIAKKFTDIKRISNCNISVPEDLNIQIASIIIDGKEALKNRTQRTFSVLRENIPFTFSEVFTAISARVSSGSDKDTLRTFRYIYNIEKVTNLNVVLKSDHTIGAIEIFLMIGIIILVSSSILLYQKYKKVSSKLQYEMNDVRNIAISSSEYREVVPKSSELTLFTKENEI